MAIREKVFIPNEIYFITFSILEWKKVFISDKYCNLIYKWFDYIRQNYGNKIYGYVIMPNHIHCLLYITDKSPELSKLIQNAKRFLAYQIVALLEEEISASESLAEILTQQELLNFFKQHAEIKKRAKHKVFADRYDSKIIQTQEMFLEKLNYIHNNPCQEKWQLADEPEDYKHSSAANYVYDKGVYDVDIVDF